MILVIGEILVDSFPTYERIGGAPFNFAFHLKQLGHNVRLITRVGRDRKGLEITELLIGHGFDPDDIQTDPDRPTGKVTVQLDDEGKPDFTILAQAAYDQLDLARISGLKLGTADMVYFGSLFQRTRSARRQLQDFLRQKAHEATRFCDLNLRSPYFSCETVERSLANTDFLKLNEEEMEVLARCCRDAGRKNSDPVRAVMDSFAISIIAVTRGERGSTLITDTGQRFHRSVETEIRVVDTVGAGDGFAAALAAGYRRQLPWETVLSAASRFAAKICGIPGAIPADSGFYDEFSILTKGGAGGP